MKTSGNQRVPRSGIDCVIWPASALGMAPLMIKSLHGATGIVQWGQPGPEVQAAFEVFRRHRIPTPFVTAAVLDWLDPHCFEP